MGSPSIDLDMNLLSSPVPPPRDDGTAGGADGDIGGVRVETAAAEGGLAGGGTGIANGGSFRTDIARKGEASRIAPTTVGSHHAEDTTVDDTAPSGDAAKGEGGKPTQTYDELTRTVESWREELYMMNVNNSIALDDLVKLGADV